jgi:hypothetical protein
MNWRRRHGCGRLVPLLSAGGARFARLLPENRCDVLGDGGSRRSGDVVDVVGEALLGVRDNASWYIEPLMRAEISTDLATNSGASPRTSAIENQQPDASAGSLRCSHQPASPTSPRSARSCATRFCGDLLQSTAVEKMTVMDMAGECSGCIDCSFAQLHHPQAIARAVSLCENGPGR